MKTLIATTSSILGSVAPAFAAGGSNCGGNSILLFLFLGFAAVIVVFQFIPGLIMFFSMLKGVFSAVPKNAPSPHGRK